MSGGVLFIKGWFSVFTGYIPPDTGNVEMEEMRSVLGTFEGTIPTRVGKD
jgi:hypothetical protein